MDIIFLLIPVAMLLVSLAAYGLFWSLKNGQYDDMDTPASQILFDDDDDLIPDEAKLNQPNKPKAKILKSNDP